MPDIARNVVHTDFYTVVDDLLSPEQCDRLWNYFQIQPFQRVDSLNLQGDWLLEDSGVLRGPTAGWGKKFDSQYPTGTPLDEVIKTLVDGAELFVSTIGKQGTDWSVMSAMATLYIAGQGLVWHRDAIDNA